MSWCAESALDSASLNESLLKLFDEQIVLVSTERQSRKSGKDDAAWLDGYVFVDWGPEYRTEHALAWPDLATPAVYFNVGTVALEFILRRGGAGYFPVRMVRQHIKDRRLFRVPHAADFHRPVYLVMSADVTEAPIESVLDGLRWIAVSAQLDDSIRERRGGNADARNVA